MYTISQKWVWQAIRMTFHRATVQRVILWESTFTNFTFLWQFLKVLSLKSTRIISKHVLPTSRDVPCNLYQLLPHAKTFPTKYWWWPCLLIFSSLFPFYQSRLVLYRQRHLLRPSRLQQGWNGAVAHFLEYYYQYYKFTEEIYFLVFLGIYFKFWNYFFFCFWFY